MVSIMPAQKRKIWSVANERGIDEESLRAVVADVSGQASTRALTIHQAVKVIDRLEGKSDNHITKRQMWKIKELEHALGWQDNPKRLKAFIKKYARTDNTRWLTKYQAKNIIDGLKSILNRV